MAVTEHGPTARVVDILEALADSREGMSLSDLARAIGSSKGTISPIIHTLAKRRLIYAGEGQKYRIGVGAYCIGASYAENMSALQFIRSQMQGITAESGEICQMGILDGGNILYVAKVDSDESIRIISHVGSRFPASCTALGKAALSEMDSGALRALYPGGLPALTPRSVTDFAELEAQLAEIRETQLALERGESNEQSNCIAVPLRKDGHIVAAVSVSVPAYRHTEEKTALIAGLLLDAKGRIELYLRDHDIDFTGSALG